MRSLIASLAGAALGAVLSVVLTVVYVVPVLLWQARAGELPSDTLALQAGPIHKALIYGLIGLAFGLGGYLTGRLTRDGEGSHRLNGGVVPGLTAAMIVIFVSGFVLPGPITLFSLDSAALLALMALGGHLGKWHRLRRAARAEAARLAVF